jgi:uncharacterized membrane protein YphA (DoxX/SURF4 family)
MKIPPNNPRIILYQQWGIIVLRIIIGWHFLYEGLVKLMDSGWSAESYLINTRGIFSGIFQEMASQPAVLEAVNFINVWGLILIGLGLFLGFFARAAAFAGIVMLCLYYIAYPPFQGYDFGLSLEGNYLLIDKNFIELATLILLSLFPRTLNIGLLSLLKKMKFRIRLTSSRRTQPPGPSVSGDVYSKNRREILKHLVCIPFLGLFSWAFIWNRKYIGKVDITSGSTIILNQQSLIELEGKIPLGDLGGRKPVSRLILGGNLIQNNAHSRDLIYVDSLFKAYNTEKKVFETLMLAEKTGINTVNIGVRTCPVINRYKQLFGSQLQTLVTVAPSKEDIYGQVNMVIDQGGDYIVIQGATCDKRLFNGEIEVVMKCVDYIKRQGYPAGLGAHTIQSLITSEEAGIVPDFYYKTMHHDRYWSAHPKENRHPFLWSSNTSEDHNEFHDNMWCLFPEETIDFVQKTKKPVVAFKVLAGGAIHPKDGFCYAFDNGADFISVGMFDFQIVEDANQMIQSFEKAKNRSRPWFG